MIYFNTYTCTLPQYKIIYTFYPHAVDVDYNSTTCDLVFPAGSGPGTMRSCFIPILDDVLVEGDETISITGITASIALPFTSFVVITDPDSKPIHPTK